MEKGKIEKKELLFHIILWFGFWVIGILSEEEENETLWELMIYSFITVFVIATVVIVNTKILIPKFLYKGKYLVYILMLLSIVSPVFILLYIIDPIPINHVIGEILQNLIYIAGISSIWLIIDQYKLREEIALKEKENIATNLKYLKAQTNPHFLFNVLNNLNFLIEKNTEKAQDVLQELSDLLRYQLYETNNEMVALNKEINHLENYINLEKIRMGDLLQLNSVFPSKNNEFKIAPFLLLPLIENAFKHSAYIDLCQIDIQCTLIENKLELKVSNPSNEQNKKSENSGIGIENLKKRLYLIYPGKFHFETKEEDNKFFANLKIEL